MDHKAFSVMLMKEKEKKKKREQKKKTIGQLAKEWGNSVLKNIGFCGGAVPRKA